jgi:hypothetical protein
MSIMQKTFYYLLIGGVITCGITACSNNTADSQHGGVTVKFPDGNADKEPVAIKPGFTTASTAPPATVQDSKIKKPL